MIRQADFGNAEQWVCQHVRQWILEGVLKSNEEVNQQELADRLGVSRSPVRDALRRLEGMGLVTINPNQRAVVTSFTLDGMYELFQMRAALEALAAHHAAANLSESDLIELEFLAEVMLRVPEVEAYLVKHEAFHDLIALRSGMPRLRRELTRLREMVTPYIRIYGSTQPSAELIGERHDALVEVLRRRDPDQAAAALSAHTHAAYEQLAAEVLCLTAERDAAAGQQSNGDADTSAKAAAAQRRSGKSRRAATNQQKIGTPEMQQ